MSELEKDMKELAEVLRKLHDKYPLLSITGWTGVEYSEKSPTVVLYQADGFDSETIFISNKEGVA